MMKKVLVLVVSCIFGVLHAYDPTKSQVVNAYDTPHSMVEENETQRSLQFYENPTFDTIPRLRIPPDASARRVLNDRCYDNDPHPYDNVDFVRRTQPTNVFDGLMNNSDKFMTIVSDPLGYVKSLIGWGIGIGFGVANWIIVTVLTVVVGMVHTGCCRCCRCCSCCLFCGCCRHPYPGRKIRDVELWKVIFVAVTFVLFIGLLVFAFVVVCFAFAEYSSFSMWDTACNSFKFGHTAAHGDYYLNSQPTGVEWAGTTNLNARANNIVTNTTSLSGFIDAPLDALATKSSTNSTSTTNQWTAYQSIVTAVAATVDNGQHRCALCPVATAQTPIQTAAIAADNTANVDSIATVKRTINPHITSAQTQALGIQAAVVSTNESVQYLGEVWWSFGDTVTHVPVGVWQLVFSIVPVGALLVWVLAIVTGAFGAMDYLANKATRCTQTLFCASLIFFMWLCVNAYFVGMIGLSVLSVGSDMCGYVSLQGFGEAIKTLASLPADVATVIDACGTRNTTGNIYELTGVAGLVTTFETTIGSMKTATDPLVNSWSATATGATLKTTAEGVGAWVHPVANSANASPEMQASSTLQNDLTVLCSAVPSSSPMPVGCESGGTSGTVSGLGSLSTLISTNAANFGARTHTSWCLTSDTACADTAAVKITATTDATTTEVATTLSEIIDPAQSATFSADIILAAEKESLLDQSFMIDQTTYTFAQMFAPEGHLRTEGIKVADATNTMVTNLRNDASALNTTADTTIDTELAVQDFRSRANCSFVQHYTEIVENLSCYSAGPSLSFLALSHIMVWAFAMIGCIALGIPFVYIYEIRHRCEEEEKEANPDDQDREENAELTKEAEAVDDYEESPEFETAPPPPDYVTQQSDPVYAAAASDVKSGN